MKTNETRKSHATTLFSTLAAGTVLMTGIVAVPAADTVAHDAAETVNAVMAKSSTSMFRGDSGVFVNFNSDLDMFYAGIPGVSESGEQTIVYLTGTPTEGIVDDIAKSLKAFTKAFKVNFDADSVEQLEVGLTKIINPSFIRRTAATVKRGALKTADIVTSDRAANLCVVGITAVMVAALAIGGGTASDKKTA